MSDNERLEFKLGVDTSELDEFLRTLGAKVQTAASQLQDVGNVLNRNVTAPILNFGKGVLQASADFEQSMNTIAAVGGLDKTGAEFDALSQKARELGRTTLFSSTEVADGIAYMMMAGADAGQALGNVETAIKLATAAGEDFAVTSDIITNIMGGMGIEFDEAGENAAILAEKLTVGFTSSNTTLRQLGKAFEYIGPVAKQAGLDMDETIAMIGMLSDAGMQGGKAGTQLRGILSTLASSYEELGVKVFESNGNMRNFADIAADLGDKGSLGLEALMDLFGRVSSTGAGLLLDDAGVRLSEFTEQIRNSEGVLDRTADTMQQGYNAALTQLQNNLTDLKQAFGDSGFTDFATNVVRGLTALVQSFAQVNPGVLMFGGVMASAAAAIGPAALAIGKFQAMLPMLKVGFAALTGPVGLAVAGIVTGAALVIANWDSVTRFFRGETEGTFSAVSQTVASAMNAVRSAIGSAVSVVKDVWGTVVDFFTNGEGATVWSNAVEYAKEAFEFVAWTVRLAIDEIVSVFQWFSKTGSDIWDKYGQYIVESTASAWNAIRDVFMSAFRIIGEVFSAATAALRGDWSTFGTSLLNILKNVSNAMVGVARHMVTQVLRMFRQMVSGIPGASALVGWVDGAIETVDNLADRLHFNVSFDVDTGSVNSAVAAIQTAGEGIGTSGASGGGGADNTSNAPSASSNASARAKEYEYLAGSIGHAQKALRDLEEAWRRATDVDTRSALSVQIQDAREALEAMTRTEVNLPTGSIAAYRNELSELRKAIDLTSDEQERLNLQAQALDLENTIAQMSRLETVLPTGSIADLEDRISKLNEQIRLTTDASELVDLSNQRRELESTRQAMIESMDTTDEWGDRLSKALEQAENAINDSLVSIASGFLQGIGSMAVGQASIKDVAKSILGTVGDLAIRLGTLALGVSKAVAGIKASLASLNPVAAAAAGVALIALGAAVKGAAAAIGNGGSGSTGSGGGNMAHFSNGGITTTAGLAMVHPREAVIPLDRLPSLLGLDRRGTGEVRHTLEMRAVGQELRYVERNQQLQMNRRGYNR